MDFRSILFFSMVWVCCNPIIAQNTQEAEISNYLKLDLAPRSSGVSLYALNPQRNISLGLGYFSSDADTSKSKSRNISSIKSHRLHTFPILLALHKNLFKKTIHLRAEAGVHLFGSNKFNISRFFHVNPEIIFSKEIFFAGVGVKKNFLVSNQFSFRESAFLQFSLGLNF